MNPADEKRIRQNWSSIKQNINVDEFVFRFAEMGEFNDALKEDINLASSDDEKADIFLEAVVTGGNKAYQTMCNIVLEHSNTTQNQQLINILDIEQRTTVNNNVPMSAGSRQLSSVSSTSTSSSLSLNLGATASNLHGVTNDRMVSARAVWRAELTPSDPTTIDMDKDVDEGRPSTPAEAVQKAVQRASDSKSGAVDMDTLEQELVKIAPTIADLFNKMQTQTTTVVASSEAELGKIKEDNDRLRKTNRTLVEKLNSFQQKIIQLQLENKKLREVSDNENIKKVQLEQKSNELESLKDKLMEQKKALEEKELELDRQMEKIGKVIRENEEQKIQLANIETLHEEGMREYEEQQQQINDLQQEKDQQKQEIQQLQENQRMSEQILYRFEERLLQLERPPVKKNRTRFGLSKPWMNGAVERSHHANVKPPQLQPQFPGDWSASGVSGKGGKGWSF